VKEEKAGVGVGAWVRLGRTWVGDKERSSSDEGEASTSSSGRGEIMDEGIGVGEVVGGATFFD